MHSRINFIVITIVINFMGWEVEAPHEINAEPADIIIVYKTLKTPNAKTYV